MANNELSFNQSATLLNALHSQATGNTALAPVDETEFVTVAQAVLRTGYDNVIQSISQVLTKTLYSVRPYDRKFKGLQADSARYGNHIRKLATIDLPAVDEDKFGLVDGQSKDHYIIRNPKVLQTNFYGFNAREDYITIYADQLNVAFSSSSEFGRFMSMIMTNINNKREQWFEEEARACIANFIKGKMYSDPSSIIHLVTEYNNKIGNTDPTAEGWLTKEDLYKPENYKAFVQWLFSRLNTLSNLMTERSVKFQVNITNKPITRHTPKQNQKVYLLADGKFEMDMMALADTYHDNYLKFADTETLTYLQSIDTPHSINNQCVYMGADGTLTLEQSALQVDNIFGLMFDEEAIGYSIIYSTMDPTPFNARGRYYDIWWHDGLRYWNDFTEKGIILLMD